MAETLLQIAGVVIPAGSGRGISQTLEPIGAGQLRRTVNGTLVDLTSPAHRKWRTTITCRDQAAPTLADLWVGETVQVSCAKKLREPVVNGGATLSRVAVDGSVRAYTADGARVSATISGQTVTAPGAAFVEYRPIMIMMLVEKSEDADEWAADESWSITLEEV